MYGCEIVWPSPIGSAASEYATSRSSGGTKSSRGTRPIAASTRSSAIPRRWSCRSTIQARSSANTSGSLHRLRYGDAEVLEHAGRDVHDSPQLGAQAGGDHGDK